MVSLWLSKNSWSLLVTNKTFPVGLSKTSAYVPSCSLYQSGYLLHKSLHHLEQDHQNNLKTVMLMMKLASHPSGMLTCITKGEVLEIH